MISSTYLVHLIGKGTPFINTEIKDVPFTCSKPLTYKQQMQNCSKLNCIHLFVVPSIKHADEGVYLCALRETDSVL